MDGRTDNPNRLICGRCRVPLEDRRVDFEYLGSSFHTEALRCPVCGLVYLPEELVRGRMREVEYQLEDK